MDFKRPQIIRPPSEHKSYFLPLTSGCSNNTCTFCNYYGSRLRLREIDDVKREIDALSLYIKYGLFSTIVADEIYRFVLPMWDQRRVFLQDGDALVYPFPKLTDVLQHLSEKFPDLERIASYATPQDLLRRSVEELKDLRELKLGILYVGVESGDEEVLQRVGKGVNCSQIIEAGRKAKEAGITLSVTVILGLAGIEGSEKHALETARILSEIDPEYCGALTLTLVPGTPLCEEWKEGNFHPISPFQSLGELKTIIEQSDFTDCFFSSMHASNYLAVRGRLPKEKEKIVKDLEYVLRKKDSSLLRPEFLRGL